jgi:hypothetical protein
MFLINRRAGEDSPNMVQGDARTVGLHHISYLMRMWEVNQVYPNTGVVVPDATPFGQNGPRWGADHWIGVVALVIFLACWLPLAFWIKLNRIDCTIISFATAHLTLYLVVLCKTGLGLYQSWSIPDSFNTIARFTVKLNRCATNQVFALSNYASSISSTVSTRGSTLNKMMIGVSYSVGGSLFIKFVQLEPDNLVEKIAMFVIGFGYACLIFTAIYENRTFELEQVDNPPVKHHQEPYGHVSEKTQGYEPPLSEDLQVAISLFYSSYHEYSVLLMLGMSCAGLSIFYWYDHTMRNNYQLVAWVLSLIGVAFGLVFNRINEVLTLKPEEQLDYRGIMSWWAKSADDKANWRRGVICITVELLALLAAIVAGIFFRF